MQGYYDENYVENSKEILKSPKHGTQDIKMASPFAYLVAYLAHLHPTLSRQSHLLHNNKLLIENFYYYFNDRANKNK